VAKLPLPSACHASCLFDEPNQRLDPENGRGSAGGDEGLAADGQTMVVVTHEWAFAPGGGPPRGADVQKGGVEEAPPGTFFTTPARRSRQFRGPRFSLNEPAGAAVGHTASTLSSGPPGLKLQLGIWFGAISLPSCSLHQPILRALVFRYEKR